MSSNYKNLKVIDYDFINNINRQKIDKEEKWINKNIMLDENEYNLDKNLRNEILEGNNRKLNFFNSKKFYYDEIYTYSEDKKTYNKKNNSCDKKNEEKKNSVIIEDNDLLKYKDYKSKINNNSEEKNLQSNNKGKNLDYMKNERNLKRKKINEIINKYRKTMKINHERSAYDDSDIDKNIVYNSNRSNCNLIKNKIAIKEIEKNDNKYNCNIGASIDDKKTEIQEISTINTVELHKYEKKKNLSKEINLRKNYSIKNNNTNIIDDNNKYKHDFQLNFDKNKIENDSYSNNLENIKKDKSYLNYYSNEENKTSNINNKNYKNSDNMNKLFNEESNKVNNFDEIYDKKKNDQIENKRDIYTHTNKEIYNDNKIYKLDSIDKHFDKLTNNNRFYMSKDKLSFSQKKKNYLDYERAKQIDFKKSTILKYRNREEAVANTDAFNSSELKILLNENKLFGEEKKIRDKFREIELMEKSIESKRLLTSNEYRMNNDQKKNEIEPKQIMLYRIDLQGELKKNSSSKNQIHENNKNETTEHNIVKNKIYNNDKKYSNIVIDKKLDFYNNTKVNEKTKYDELKIKLFNDDTTKENMNNIKKSYKSNSETLLDDNYDLNKSLNASVVKNYLNKSEINILKKNYNYKKQLKINKETLTFKKDSNAQSNEIDKVNNILDNNLIHNNENKKSAFKSVSNEISDILDNNSLINNDDNKRSIFYDAIEEPLYKDENDLKESIKKKINKNEEKLNKYDYEPISHYYKTGDVEKSKWNNLKTKDFKVEHRNNNSRTDDKKKEERQLCNNDNENFQNFLFSKLKEINKRGEKVNNDYITKKSVELSKRNKLNIENVNFLKNRKLFDNYEENKNEIRNEDNEEKEEKEEKSLNENENIPKKNNIEKNFNTKSNSIKEKIEYTNGNIYNGELFKDHLKFDKNFINLYNSKNIKRNNENYLNIDISDEINDYKIRNDVNSSKKNRIYSENKEININDNNLLCTKIKYDCNFEINNENFQENKKNKIEYLMKCNNKDKKNMEICKNEKDINSINGKNVNKKFMLTQNSVKKEVFSKNNIEKSLDCLKETKDNSYMKIYQNALSHSVDSLNNINKENNNKNYSHDLFLSRIDNLLKNQKKNKNKIDFSNRKMNEEKSRNNIYSEEEKKNSNEKIKEKLEMIKQINNEQKINIDEKNKLKHEISIKRKLYELKIRKEFEEKIRLRRKLNEQKILQEKKKEHINYKDDDNKKKKEKEGAEDKDKELEIEKEKEKKKEKEKEKMKKKKLFEDYSSDGSYYKYVYRNLYEETCNKKTKNHFYDIGDNLYLQECSDNFFHNNKSHSSIDNSISNSFDNELISLSKIKFDDFDYNYLNERKISIYTKKENSSYVHKSESDSNIKNKFLIKPKVILTDNENNCTSDQRKNRRFEEEKYKLSYKDDLNNHNKRDIKISYSMKDEKKKPSDYSNSIYNSNEYKKNNEVLNKLLSIKYQNKINKNDINKNDINKNDINKKNGIIIQKNKIEKILIEKNNIDEVSNTNEENNIIEKNVTDKEIHLSEENHVNEKNGINEINNINEEIVINKENNGNEENNINEKSNINKINLIEENGINKENNINAKEKISELHKINNEDDNINEENDTNVYNYKLLLNNHSCDSYSIEHKQMDYSKKYIESEKQISNINFYGNYNDIKENKNSTVKSSLEKSNLEKLHLSKSHSNKMEYENKIKNKSSLSKTKEYCEHLTNNEISLNENEEKKKDDDMKSSLSSSDNIIPKINILQNKENYIPLDVALNFVMDNQKLKKNIQKENKGNKKKKTFVQWLMEERKKRLKNNLPIDI
ncbi:conserved Plasmodium protein, unknown function [Plasmodium relictum]|uniref:Uncharacterized protein n=1 Tax=Plasmodium relictum TaxID=85471 RepID=A0A1J1HCR9_PLARL|nr:conserved Plasmodium protein, unknown function [Plasmodium relictum]CRH03715.1 conserved Plasmodium protein, unknown function [Plasmodium relictum]